MRTVRLWQLKEVDVEANPGTGPEQPQEDQARISEEGARKLVEQLRSTPAEQIIADVLSTLLTAADVKLGRRDARLFIDLCSAILEQAAPWVSDELGKQVENALGQLRLGQVSAENHVLKKGEPEPNDLSRVPRPPATGARTGPPSGGQSTDPKSSGLWVPGGLTRPNAATTPGSPRRSARREPTSPPG